MTFQTHGMEVWHQKPYSGFYGAQAKVFESHDYYIDSKRSESDGPDKGNQTSPVPGQLAYQGLVSGRSTSEHSDSGRPDPVLRMDNKSG